MNKIITLATHNITKENNFGFSAKEYSKFKFGSSKVGQLFGDELFEKLIDLKESELSSYNKIYVFTSPYDFIPTATNTIFESFFDKLSKHLTSRCIVEKRKIHRNTTYTNDYGALSKDQRMKLISNDSFKLKNDFEGNELLIFLDDIKITGSHEFVVKKTLKENKITNDVFFIYHAILDNKNIDPTFENYLNYSYVKSVNEILNIYKKSDFVLNTRFTKYILQLSDNDINYFLSCIEKEGLEEIILASKGNKYNNIPEYFRNLKKIIKLHFNLTNTL
ncbi:MAG: phosphoribosyltransferase family protein [Flavobacteriaceae bacterium]|nr:phosphoribosyltransferase family protein [Flavobacteriaceae bacterium]